MILESLKYIATDLDSHLKKKYASSESKVKLANILDQDGSIPEANQNKVLLSLLSLEHESVTQNAVAGLNSSSSFYRVNPPLSFNVNIMFSSLFNQYEEGLKFLSDTIYFFQARSLFNAQNSPHLDERIFQLSLEVMKLNFSETYNLWASLGAKYIPSIPFKMRMLTFQNDELTKKTTKIFNQGSGGPPFMKSQRYILLAEVTLLHNYFEDGYFRDIRIVPDKVTQTFMWNAGLLFRHTDTGFSIFYSDPFNVEYLKEITSFFNNQLLRFQLFGESSDFMNYTESPLGRLVVYKYNNRDTQESDETHLMLPKLEQRLYSQSPMGEIDFYLSEFLNQDTIFSKDYIIMFSARSTRWKYYVMNIAEAEADRLIIEDSVGNQFVGPIKREMPGSKSAFEFSSGEVVFPFQEQPKTFCSLKKRSLVSTQESQDAAADEILMQTLPVPSPQAITTIETDEDEQVPCSSVYIYL